jgi:hypothetical protein
MIWKPRGMSSFAPSRASVEHEKQLIAEGKMPAPDPALVERLRKLSPLASSHSANLVSPEPLATS